METFGFYKIIKTDNERLKKASSKLHNLYNKIPDTTGCLENIGECKGWCCKFQSPQLLYSEFLNLWRRVIKDWSVEDICDVIEKSLKHYVLGEATKGCVFFDVNTKMCKVHKHRPYNCRIYGITPDEEFRPRYERMKELYKNVIEAVIREQCDLIETVDSFPLTVEDTNSWWEQLIQIEHSLGIPKQNINDDMGGSYRTPHDHVLLYMMPDEIMQKLQGIRLMDDYHEKMKIVNQYMLAVRGSMQDE